MPADPNAWAGAGFELSFDRTRIMGILNVTPDSFSDGGKYFEAPAAIDRGLAIADEGADVIDIGGESTRPGAAGVPGPEEWRRIGPVIKALASKVDAILSVDTTKPDVAGKALTAGAKVVNDVRGLRDPAMVALVKRRRAGTVVMHMQGEPRTMQRDPRYHDVVHEVRAFLTARVGAAETAGIPLEAIVVDPGVGFGKRPEHNVELLRNLASLRVKGRPVLAGVSRKSFLGALGGGKEPTARLESSLAAGAFAVLRGASMLRAHDVAAHVRMVRTLDALRSR